MSISDKRFEIDSDATPEEIMAQWTLQQQQAGIDPNAALQSQFGKNGATTIRPVVNEPARDAQGRFTPQQQQTTEPETVTKTEVIAGREITFTGDSEHEVNELILNAYKIAEAVAPENIAAQRQDNSSPEMQALRRSELDLQFRRGQISPKEYLEKSGAYEEFLQDHGTSIELIQQTTEQVQNANIQQSWADAVEQFLHSPAGADWPGGDNNKDLIGLQLQSLGLMEATDKAAALAQAYQSLKSRNMLFKPSQEVLAEAERSTLEEQMAQASTPEEIQLAMENWKSNVATQGQDPNAFFVRTNARTGRDTTYNPAAPSGERMARGSSIFGK